MRLRAVRTLQIRVEAMEGRATPSNAAINYCLPSTQRDESIIHVVENREGVHVNEFRNGCPPGIADNGS